MKFTESMRRLVGLCLLAFMPLGGLVAQASEVTVRSIPSKGLNADSRYTVYLPDGTRTAGCATR